MGICIRGSISTLLKVSQLRQSRDRLVNDWFITEMSNLHRTFDVPYRTSKELDLSVQKRSKHLVRLVYS